MRHVSPAAGDREELERLEEPSLPILVDGDWRPSRSDRTDPVYNPAHGTVLARVPHCTPEEVDEAVASAARAFPGWQATPVGERVQVLFRYKQLLEQHLDDLVRLVSSESGKLLSEARSEVRRGIEAVDFACGLPGLLRGESAPGTRGVEGRAERVPLGPVAGICPFGLPALIPLWTFPVAVGAGNTFVLKPSERTPLTAVRLAELAVEAGLPEGALSLVHGGREVAERILDHPDVRAVSFVGSEAVARRVRARAAAGGKRVRALGGAGSRLVVLPDADPDLAVEAVMASAFGDAGQRCLAGSVAVAVGAGADRLLERLARQAGAVRVGDPFDEGSEMGPLIRPEARDRVLGWIEAALSEGARLLVDGRRRIPPRGFFLAPTVLEEARPEAAAAREEVFGPVLSLLRAGTLEEAIALVNRSRRGGAACVFTRSGQDAWLFRARVAAGMVGVNVGAGDAGVPFPGWRRSPGGPLAAGEDAVRFHTATRLVVERWG